jgi:hypothetical protein
LEIEEQDGQERQQGEKELDSHQPFQKEERSLS